MTEPTTASLPVLPTFLPRPAGIPVASLTMQKILTKTIRHHADNQNLSNTQVKGPEKVGGKRGGRGGRSGKSAARSTARGGSTRK